MRRDEDHPLDGLEGGGRNGLWPSENHGRAKGAWKAWAAAVALAILWHGVWMAWLQPLREEAPERTPRFPLASYVPFPAAAASVPEELEADVRLIWSPVLFSLPTPIGFSRAALTNQIGVRPPLALPMRTFFYVDRPSALAPSSSIHIVRSLSASARDELAALALRPVERPVFPAFRSRKKPLYLELAGGLAGAEFERVDLSKTIWVEGEQPWEMTIYAEYNEHGVLTSAILDRPTPFKRVNQLILRKLAESRLKNPGRGRDGRILLRYAGSAPQPPERKGWRP